MIKVFVDHKTNESGEILVLEVPASMGEAT